MIDTLMLEAFAAAGCVGIGVVSVAQGAARARSAAAERRVPARNLGRLVAQLPYRRRREVRAIVALAREQLERHPAGSAELFTAREALRAYLPETLCAYLAIPPALRRARRSDGLSPDDELGRQLRTLHAGLERLRAADAATAASRMAANGAFLDERFGPAQAAEPALSVVLRSAVREIVDLLGVYLRRA